jgi:hypothetical protein
MRMAPRPKQNGRIDEQVEETFPASDPPSFMGGEVLGAPSGRKTRRPALPRKKAKKAERAVAKKRPAKKAVTKKVKKKKSATKRRKAR